MPAATETIAAIATPPGFGGVGIVRISGPGVPDLARALLGQLPSPRHAHYARFRGDDGVALDEGLALYFPAPNSFTGEHVLELQGNPHSIGQLYNSGLHTLLTRVQAEKNPTELETGIELANRLISGAFESRLFLVALEALLLRARMYALLGNKPASQADYLHALELAEPEGFIGIFLEHGPPIAKALEDLMKLNLIGTVRTDYVRRILDVFSSSDSHLDISPASVSSAKSRQAGLIDPLTERELDVLRLIARGLKYKEIADNLFISQNTVRFHVKAIYGKLNVNNRTQAIEKARQLQIL